MGLFQEELAAARVDDGRTTTDSSSPLTTVDSSSGVSLAKVQSTMNDGTGSALVGAQEIEKMVVEERRRCFTGTEEEWDALPDTEKSVYKWRCNNHRRVLVVAEYQREEAKLDDTHPGLTRTKESGDAHWRMTDVALASVLRSIGKLAVGSKKKDAYVKGDNVMLFAWAEEVKGELAFADMGRLDLGSRFDWVCRASFGAFYNLEHFFAPYLDIYLGANDSNILRDALTSIAASIYVKSKLFVSAVIFDKLMNPFNALINSKKIGLSITDLAGEYDKIREFGATLRAGCLAVLDENFRIFDGIAGLDEWEAFEVEKKQRSINGNKKVSVKRTIRAHLYGTVNTEDWAEMKPHVIAHFQAYGRAIETSLVRNCLDMLSPDGEFSKAKQDNRMREVAAKCDTTDDANEQAFAIAKFLKKSFSSMTESTLLALACVRQNSHLKIPPKPRDKKSKLPSPKDNPEVMRLVNLPLDEQAAHVRAARGAAGEAHKAAVATEVQDFRDHERTRLAKATSVSEQKAVKKWRDMDAVFQQNPWLPTPRAIDAAVKTAGSKTKAAAILEGQVKRARLAGWAPSLIDSDPSLNLTLRQGGGGIEKQLPSLLTTCKKVLQLSKRLKLKMPAVAPDIGQLGRDVPNICGEITEVRRTAVAAWEQKRADVMDEAKADDPELTALEREFVGQKFVDDDDEQAVEQRIIIGINWNQEFSRFMADTRKLDRSGRQLPASRRHADDFYGLHEDELPEMRRMMAIFT